MNLHDIAKEFGIARSTVSSCLSGQEGKYGIRVELAKAVRAYAQRHGYVPNRAAIKLRGRGGASPLGLVFTYESGMAKVILPIRRIVEYLASIRREYVLMGIENGLIGATMATLRSMDVTEVVVLGALHEPYPKESPDERERRFQEDWRVAWGLLESGMRLYASDYIFPVPPEHAKINMVRVGLNTEKMARDVLRKMLDSGLGPVVFSRWLKEQEHSFIPELLEDAEMILPMKYSGWPLDEGLALAETILELRKRRKVRSAFIGNDYVAAGVIKGLLDHGIRVPEDIAVIGFGNYDTAPFFTRALTTVGAACGEKGLDLVKSICGDLPPFPVNNELDYHIFERESLQFKPTEKQRKARKILKV